MRKQAKACLLSAAHTSSKVNRAQRFFWTNCTLVSERVPPSAASSKLGRGCGLDHRLGVGCLNANQEWSLSQVRVDGLCQLNFPRRSTEFCRASHSLSLSLSLSLASYTDSSKKIGFLRDNQRRWDFWG